MEDDETLRSDLGKLGLITGGAALLTAGVLFLGALFSKGDDDSKEDDVDS
jgi:hypothetical protein